MSFEEARVICVVYLSVIVPAVVYFKNKSRLPKWVLPTYVISFLASEAYIGLLPRWAPQKTDIFFILISLLPFRYPIFLRLLVYSSLLYVKERLEI